MSCIRLLDTVLHVLTSIRIGSRELQWDKGTAHQHEQTLPHCRGPARGLPAGNAAHLRQSGCVATHWSSTLSGASSGDARPGTGGTPSGGCRPCRCAAAAAATHTWAGPPAPPMQAAANARRDARPKTSVSTCRRSSARCSTSLYLQVGHSATMVERNSQQCLKCAWEWHSWTVVSL